MKNKYKMTENELVKEIERLRKLADELEVVLKNKREPDEPVLPDASTGNGYFGQGCGGGKRIIRSTKPFS